MTNLEKDWEVYSHHVPGKISGIILTIALIMNTWVNSTLGKQWKII